MIDKKEFSSSSSAAAEKPTKRAAAKKSKPIVDKDSDDGLFCSFPLELNSPPSPNLFALNPRCERVR